MAIPMVLEIWSGACGLPSIDQSCLETMAYAKFSGVPLKLERKDSPFWTPTGKFPVFRHGKTVLLESRDVMAHFKKENYSAEFASDDQLGDVFAYEAMVRTRLKPGIMFTWWLDERNYTEVVRPMYAKKLPFCWNYFYPGHYQRRAKEAMWAMFDLKRETPVEQECNWGIIETEVNRMGVECLNQLSAKLGAEEFFSGSSPKFIDAVIFSHLAPLLKIPLPKSHLQAHLRACPNLVGFVDRVLQRYFPLNSEDKYQSEDIPRNWSKVGPKLDDDSFDHRWRSFLAVFAAAGAMGLYAIYAGHVYVNVRRKPEIADIETLEAAVGDFYEPSEDGDQT